MRREIHPEMLNGGSALIVVLLIHALLQVTPVASFPVPTSNCYTFDNTSHIHDFTSWIGHHLEHEGKDYDTVLRFCKDVESRSQKGYIDFGRFDTLNDFVTGSGHIDFVQSSAPKGAISLITPFSGPGHSLDQMCRLLEVPNRFGPLAGLDVRDDVNLGRLRVGVGGESSSSPPTSLDCISEDSVSSYGPLARLPQGFYSGDLTGCEQTYDKLGRTAQANIICGNCLNGQCTGDLGCICNVTYDSACRVTMEVAVPCVKGGPRIFEGFTVGFHPRSWEVVYNGMTNLGYEKLHHEFSFGTEQTCVSLYMTAVSSVSNLVGKPTFKVNPSKGLEIKLSGTGAAGSPPTTLSPTMLDVDWTCEIARDIPYEVLISIPVEGYEPIEFTLTKNCKNKQNRKEDATVGWATFGVLSCIFTVVSTLLCCGGFIYKTRVQHQHGLDAVPGMTVLSACLETVTGGGGGYSRVEDLNSAFVNQASWERQPVSSQSSQRTSERKYGAI